MQKQLINLSNTYSMLKKRERRNTSQLYYSEEFLNNDSAMVSKRIVENSQDNTSEKDVFNGLDSSRFEYNETPEKIKEKCLFENEDNSDYIHLESNIKPGYL